MAIYWETPDKRDPRLPPQVKIFYKAELDELGRMRLWSRRANKGRWGYRTAWPDEALEALITELEAKEREFNERMDMISKPLGKHAYQTRPIAEGTNRKEF